MEYKKIIIWDIFVGVAPFLLISLAFIPVNMLFWILSGWFLPYFFAGIVLIINLFLTKGIKSRSKWLMVFFSPLAVILINLGIFWLLMFLNYPVAGK